MAERFDKLKKPSFIDFRLRRRDRDWEVGEVVQVVLHPRSRQREVLGIAKIVDKESRSLFRLLSGIKQVTHKEAQEDGFNNRWEMGFWMVKRHGDRVNREPLNKLTLEWLHRGPILD